MGEKVAAMAGLDRISIGEQARLNDGLMGVGFTRQDIEDIAAGPTLATELLEIVRRHRFGAPKWWSSAEQQIARSLRLWPDLAVPEVPRNFEPESGTEVLLLHTTDDVDDLWRKIEPPEGYSKGCGLSALGLSITLADYVPMRPDPVWLGFDFAANIGVEPRRLSRRSDGAASEVLSALVQFPGWISAWACSDAPLPFLSGFVAYRNWGGDNVPCVRLRGTELTVGATATDLGAASYCSPIVREILVGT